MPTATAFLNVARSQLGYREGPNNDNKYGRWYTDAVKNGINWNHQAYCAMGLTWCAAQLDGGLNLIGGYWAYCPYWANWARGNRLWHYHPERGDIVFFDWSGLARKERHVAAVETVRNASYIQTVEFNTTSGSAGNQSDGGGVYRRVRHTSFVVGYLRPRWDAEKDVVAVPGPTVPLVVDGVWGPRTVAALQRLLRVDDDGEMGPITFDALAVWLGQKPVGGWSRDIKTALQHRVGATADGIIGPKTVRALQRYLNRFGG